MPNLLPRAALKGAGTALMEKFALPSERKAIAQLAEMQGAYNTPYSLQNIGKDLGQELGGADDMLGSAMNARLGDGAATLERHAPETQGLVEKIWNRIQNRARWFGESRVTTPKGAPETLYHGTRESFKSFKTSGMGSHFGTDKAANHILMGERDPKLVEEWIDPSLGRVLPVNLSVKHPLTMRDAGDWDHLPSVLQAMPPKEVTEELLQKLAPIMKRKDLKPVEVLKRELQKRGYDGIRYINEGEDAGKVSWIAFQPNQVKSIFNRGTYSRRTGDILKGAAVAGAGLGAAELASPDSAEAAPKIKLTPALLDEAGTVVKDLLKPKGAVEFDINRRWWGKRLGSGGLFWDRRNDDQKFLSWVTPYIEEAKRIDPKAGAQAEKWLEIGRREPNSFKYYELALQTLHRPITHESAGANAVTDMMSKFGPESAREALLRSAPSPATKEALSSTLDYWKHLVGLAGAGLAGLGLGADEAEAAPRPSITKAIRILRSMATTPERQRLLEEAMPYLERELSRPGIKRAWLAGSYGTKKPNPSDIDLVIHPNPEYRKDWFERIKETIFQDGQRQLAADRGDLAEAASRSRKMRELGTRFGLPPGEKLPVDTLRVGNFADPTAPTMKEISAVGKERYGGDYKFTRLLQATLATAGLGGLGLGGNEAEAAPKIPIPINANKALRKSLGEKGLKGLLEKVEELVPRPNYRMETKIRTMSDIAEGKMGIESSASKFLKGMDLMGKQVSEVRKGNGNWRYIVFEDGTYLPIDKKYIASLSSSEGEKLYGQMFDMSTPRDRKLMLGRSGAIANARGIPNKVLKESLTTRKTLLEDLGEEAPNRITTLLGGRNKDLPEPYAWGVMKYGDQGRFNRQRLAPPREVKEPEVRIKDFLAPSFRETPPGRKLAAESLKAKSPIERSIFNLEKAKSTKGISPGDEYMLRRFKGMDESEAAKDLKLVSQPSIERMVGRILQESPKASPTIADKLLQPGGAVDFHEQRMRWANSFSEDVLPTSKWKAFDKWAASWIAKVSDPAERAILTKLRGTGFSDRDKKSAMQALMRLHEVHTHGKVTKLMGLPAANTQETIEKVVAQAPSRHRESLKDMLEWSLNNE